MSDAAARISLQRKEFISQIQTVIQRLLETEELELPLIQYHQGWRDGLELRDCLREERTADRKMGFTQSGIHRADLLFRVQDLPLASVFSRGRTKQYVSTLLLAQAEVIRAMTGIKPLILIDDFAAEIDSTARTRLFDLLITQGMQAFLTATEEMPALAQRQAVSVFHVEHGNLQKVVK